jgi:anti-repressor protein
MELAVFKSSEFGRIRVIEQDGDPWFIGKDVAEILGYSNTRDALSKHVDEDDKNTVVIRDGIGNPNKVIINESGLYSLILSSKLPTAKRFKHWVTSEVLPAVRKHGAYMTPQKIEEVLTNPDTIIRLAMQLKEEQQARRQAEELNVANAPKVLFAEAVSTSHISILIGDLAKILRGNGVDIGQKRLFKWMRDHGYLIKQKGTSYNMPTQKAMELGLFRVKEGTYINGSGANVVTKTTKVTGKGQIYFINKFRELRGI